MSTFSVDDSYALSTHTIQFNGNVLEIYQGRTKVASHDLAQNSVSVQVISGDFCVGTITWGTYHFTKQANISGPCGGIEYQDGGAKQKFVGHDNDEEGGGITNKEVEISSTFAEFWVSSGTYYMKMPCEGSSACSNANYYQEEDGGTCNP